MNNEEMERMMQFILQQQAQTTVRVDQIAETDERIAEKVDRVTERIERIAEKIDKLTDAQLKYEARAGRLEESFLILVQLAQSTDERLDEVGRKMSEVGDKINVLTDAQIRTDKNIRNLTAVVDRYFSEGRSGMS